MYRRKGNNMKRFVPMVLLGALILASCGGETAVSTDAATSATPAADTTNVIETIAETFDVPDMLDFGGRIFTILACDENVPYTYIEDVEEENGDAMNDAIFLRNNKVEEYLNVDIQVETVKGTKTLPRLQQDIMSGDALFDMVSPHIIDSIYTFVTEKNVVDLSSLDYVDFTKSWWNGSFAETMAINGNVFYASGDMIVPNVRVIVFNKQMMEDYKLPDIYETIRTGKWTLDSMGSYTKNMVRDLNGDNVFDEKDQYAFSDLSNTGLATSFLHASGQLIVEREGSDNFRVTLQDEKMHVLFDKLYTYLYAEGNTKITNTNFANGNVLFGSQVLLKLQILRDAETDFGVIPFPKYDEVQDKYYSSVWNGLVCIPVTAKDMECCGAVLESMAYYSSDTLVPAYYEKLLGGKFARDDDSVEMLDIIFDGLVFDIGFCYDNRVGCFSVLGTLLNQGNTNLSSFAESKMSTYEEHYRTLFDSVS